jgi:hypothetical protein
MTLELAPELVPGGLGREVGVSEESLDQGVDGLPFIHGASPRIMRIAAEMASHWRRFDAACRRPLAVRA